MMENTAPTHQLGEEKQAAVPRCSGAIDFLSISSAPLSSPEAQHARRKRVPCNRITSSQVLPA